MLLHSLLDSGTDAGGELTELVGAHLHMVCEVEVARLVEGHKVYVRMGHVDTHHGFADLDAGAHLLEALGDALGEEMELAEELVVEVEDVVHLLLGDAEDMAADHGVDIEECQTAVCLKHFVAGYLAGYDFAEDCCHGLSFYFGQLESHLAGRDIDLDDVAHLVAEESRSKGRSDGYLALLEVGFALGDDGVALRHVVLGVADGDDGEQEHLGGVYLALVEQTCVGHEFLQLGDASLEVALGLLGGVVLGILAEVALVARLGDGGAGGRTLDGNQVMQLVLQFLKAFFTVILYL